MNDIDELLKEVFAHFGAAYCNSEILHKTLCVIFTIATFEKPEHITGPRIEEKLSIAFSLTLGQIAEKTKDLLPIGIQDKLQIALAKRNYLAHHFWFEKSHIMYNRQNLLELRQELTELSAFFINTDEFINKHFESKFQSFGLTDQLRRESFEKLLKGEIDEPIRSRRKLRRQERIVKVWDVNLDDKSTIQIFESEDGCLWQLSDVGLGWTSFESTLSNWTVNENLQKYMPATINPRPLITKPWNYEFDLAKGIVLWVKPGKREKSYKIGIKKLSKT